MLSHEDAQVRKHCQGTLHSAGASFVKGGPGIQQVVHLRAAPQSKDERNEKLRRISKRLARLYELRRLLQNNDSQRREPQITLLCRKLWRRPIGDNFASRWQLCNNAIADAKADQTREEDEQKSLRLLNWKERINQPNLKHLSRWVRQRESGCKPVVLTHGDHIAWNRQEATKLIKNYWTEAWKKQDDH